MGAPKGNQFWKLRAKHGRDRLFKNPQELWKAICEYFQWCDNNPLKKQEILKYRDSYEKVDSDLLRPYTLNGLCLYLGCNLKYFHHFENSVKDKDDELSNDFSNIITRAREIIYNQKFEGAAANLFNANIIARELGLSEKNENTVKVEQPLFPDVDYNKKDDE